MRCLQTGALVPRTKLHRAERRDAAQNPNTSCVYASGEKLCRSTCKQIVFSIKCNMNEYNCTENIYPSLNSTPNAQTQETSPSTGYADLIVWFHQIQAYLDISFQVYLDTLILHCRMNVSTVCWKTSGSIGQPLNLTVTVSRFWNSRCSKALTISCRYGVDCPKEWFGQKSISEFSTEPGYIWWIETRLESKCCFFRSSLGLII